jgi:peptidyl-prolyl cis-trans isomerase C
MSRMPGHGIPWPVLAALAAVAMACSHRQAPPPSDVAAAVGGSQIPYQDIQVYLSSTLGDAETGASSAVLSQLLDQYLEERLMLRLAVDGGLVPAGSAVRQAIDALLRQAATAPPSAAEIAEYYRRHRQDFARPERVRLRQILTEDRRTAERAERAIRGGEDFAAVARRLSRDAAAGGGGYQGELARSDLPPAFVDVIFALRPGEVSRVMPADYGFHIFQVLERLPAAVEPLDSAGAEIAARLRRERADRARAALVQQARARYNARVYERNLPFEYEGSYGENHSHRSTPASAGSAPDGR